jgi:biopolymer transport protein ExbB
MVVAQMGAGQSYAQVLFMGGGVIGWIIWLISVATLALIITYLIQIRRANILPALVQMQIQELFEQKQYREAIDLTTGEPSFLSYVVHAALADAAHGYPAMERAMEEAGEERTTKLLRSIEWLNLIGNIGPMLGLLGTVWGMIQAFLKIVEAGGIPDPGKLAGAIGIALVTTLLGLSVAIPALSVYAIMRNRIDALTSEAMLIGQQLIANFRPGGKGAQA